MVVAHSKPPIPVPMRKTEAVKRASSTLIVFEISAMDRPTIEEVKNALEQKARQMIQAVEVPYELEVLSKQGEDELKSLQCADVTIEIGEPASCASSHYCLSSLLFCP